MNSEMAYYICKWLGFQVFSDKDCDRRSRLIALVANQIVWDVKEPTHFSKRVGDVVPGVVV